VNANACGDKGPRNCESGEMCPLSVCRTKASSAGEIAAKSISETMDASKLLKDLMGLQALLGDDRIGENVEAPREYSFRHAPPSEKYPFTSEPIPGMICMTNAVPLASTKFEESISRWAETSDAKLVENQDDKPKLNSDANDNSEAVWAIGELYSLLERIQDMKELLHEAQTTGKIPASAEALLVTEFGENKDE